MVRNYKKGNNKRPYLNYDLNVMKAAVDNVKAGMKIGIAAENYQVSCTTLQRHVYGTNKPGRPSVLRAEEETVIADTLKQIALWGIGFDSFDLKILVKYYLDSIGKYEERFKNNWPGMISSAVLKKEII